PRGSTTCPTRSPRTRPRPARSWPAAGRAGRLPRRPARPGSPQSGRGPWRSRSRASSTTTPTRPRSRPAPARPGRCPASRRLTSRRTSRRLAGRGTGGAGAGVTPRFPPDPGWLTWRRLAARGGGPVPSHPARPSSGASRRRGSVRGPAATDGRAGHQRGATRSRPVRCGLATLGVRPVDAVGRRGLRTWGTIGSKAFASRRKAADGEGGTQMADADAAGGAGTGNHDQSGNDRATPAKPPARARVTLTGISSRAWEHPADRGALTALRELKGFDEVLKVIAGVWNERAWRLQFLGGAIRVDHRQYPRVHRIYAEAATALDVKELPELFVQNDRTLNAMAVGMKQPFIVVNTGMLEVADDDELRCLLGHELGHVLSGHAVYRTMIIILTRM